MAGHPTTGLQLRSLIKASGELELRLADVAVGEPAADEVVVRIEASPINPSDLGLLLGPADLSTTRTAMPFCKRAHARPRPAGPAPTTNTCSIGQPPYNYETDS